MDKGKPDLSLVPAEVFARLDDHEISIVLFPGNGLADQSPMAYPINKFPKELRVPNAKIWIRFDQLREILEVLSRPT